MSVYNPISDRQRAVGFNSGSVASNQTVDLSNYMTIDQLNAKFISKFGGAISGSLEVAGNLKLNNELQLNNSNINRCPTFFVKYQRFLESASG